MPLSPSDLPLDRPPGNCSSRGRNCVGYLWPLLRAVPTAVRLLSCPGTGLARCDDIVRSLCGSSWFETMEVQEIRPGYATASREVCSRGDLEGTVLADGTRPQGPTLRPVDIFF